MTAINPAWIAIDWGTTNLRVWAMGPDDQVLDHKGSSDGMDALERDGFEPALLNLVAPWLADDRTIPAIACGMVGAREGWIEAPYRQVPCAPIDSMFCSAPVRDKRISVSIVPGLSQMDPADVMRGEETQIAGLVADAAIDQGVLCLPGTHSKWAAIQNGSVERFVTVMTGELFALLSKQSVLRHGMTQEGWDDQAFIDGLQTALDDPATLTANLFTLRAEGLLKGLSPQSAKAQLSGLLMGIELSGTRSYWHNASEVHLIGDGALSRLYADALANQSVPVQVHDADRITLAGLCTAHKRYKDTAP